MDYLRKNFKGILIIVALVLIGYFVYSFFLSGPNPSDTLAVSAPGDGAQVGADLLLLLANMKTIKLDDSIFSDPIFKALHNFKVEVSPEPIGRPNPFAPLSGPGSDSSLNVQVKSFKTQ